MQERADWSMYDGASITFDSMAFGQPVEAIGPNASFVDHVLRAGTTAGL